MRKKVICAAISSVFGTSAGMAAESDEPARHNTEIEEIIVRALPFSRNSLESAQPVDLLIGEELDDQRGMTLGETLQNQPGVHSSYYGNGAGRPIIRGMNGPRVRILEDGLSTADASAQSDDHAISVDPLLIEQIEILRGPATLLYGSAASGGVVNVIDGRIPEAPAIAPVSGRFELRGDNVADERSGAARLDGGSGDFAWHLDGSWRDADDFRIPGRARLEQEDELDADHDVDHDSGLTEDGRLANSFVENWSATTGASWVGDRGFLGASVRQFQSEYGIPAPHGHESNDHDTDTGQEEDDEEFSFIDMEQTSWDIKGGMDSPVPGIARATMRLGYNDYRHVESPLEDHDSDHDHEEEEGGTVFDIDTFQGRFVVETEPLSGWEGAYGLQIDEEDFVAEGEEAFVPDNETRSVGVFALQERSFDALTVSLGARIEDSRMRLRDHDVDRDTDHETEHEHDADHEVEDENAVLPDVEERNFTTWSLSVGGIWQINELWQGSLNLSRSQRAPSATELFAEGPHLTTFSFEEGEPRLEKETTSARDLNFHRHTDNLDIEISLFQKDVSDFIQLVETGEERDGLPVRETRQANADFWGVELSAVWQLASSEYGHFDLRADYDMVRGSWIDGGDLPRISPQRVGGGLDWHRGRLRGSIDAYRVLEQDRVAEFETGTPGYNMVNAQLAYRFDVGGTGLEAFIKGENLGDQDARVATSFLKEFAPLPGRSLTIGIRGSF